MRQKRHFQLIGQVSEEEDELEPHFFSDAQFDLDSDFNFGF